VLADLNAVEKAARDTLAADKLRTFRQRLAGRHVPVNDCDVYLARALLLDLEGDFKKAEELLDRLGDLMPDDAQRHRILGLTYYDQKEYRRALDELGDAVEEDSSLTTELKAIMDVCEKAADKNP